MLCAQSETRSGNITGAVEDSSGSRVAAAAVRIVSDGDGQVWNLLTRTDTSACLFRDL
jgi:hypothetical protein